MLTAPTTQPPRPTRRLRNRLGAALVAAIVASTGCSSDGASTQDPGDSRVPLNDFDAQPEAQPIPGTEVFGEGDLGSVPLISGSNRIGPIDTTADGVIAATYTVNQLTAPRAIESMADLLAANGWEQLIAPVERPEGAFRTEWARDGRRLEVVATDVTGLDDSSRMQYSVVLHPDLDDTDVDAGRASTD